MRKHFVAFVFISLILGNNAYSSPAFEIGTSGNCAEKGHTIDIFVEITSIEPLSDILLSISEPEGFHVQAVQSPGMDIPGNDENPGHNIIKINSLGANSSVTATFKIWAPDIFGRPKTGNKQSLYSTRDPKMFPVNIFYKSMHDSSWVEGSYTSRVSIRYTTSIGHYLAAGLLGIILGFIVKIMTQYKQDIDESLKESSAILQKIKILFIQIFMARLPLLLTLLIVGFGILLALAKDAMPVSSWHQAIALGVGIGILSDEQLITKVKKIAL